MKKVLLTISALAIVLATAPLFAAWEAHVINVTAEVENGLQVSSSELSFGTVIPQEYLEKGFTITLSDSFMSSSRLDDIIYQIIQMPKPIWPKPQLCQQEFSKIDQARRFCINNPTDQTCCYLSLCPYLSKNDADPEDLNDTSEPSYFHDTYCAVSGQASGKLIKSEGDVSDSWEIDLKVPPIEGTVGLDWPEGCPTLLAETKYGCDLYIQVTEVSESGTGGPGCTPTIEVCDNLDNDCDGLIDEQLTQNCYSGPGGTQGIGLCHAGTQTCSDGIWGSCVGEVTPSPEICGDGIDNDCDGQTDESCPPPCTPSTEICNGIDDDCDPNSADGSEDPQTGSACDGVDNDLCLEGTRSCTSGALYCSDNTSSTVDICNGMDDDCDPASVDGSEDPQTGTACDGPDSDLCSEGTRSCSAGALSCSDNTSSTVDICNGINDDCDAASADGSEDPLNGTACDGPDSDLCLEGIRSCSAGALSCSDNTGSTIELCNGIDDDCDGQVDEGC